MRLDCRAPAFDVVPMRLTLKIENQDALPNGHPLIQVLDRKGIQIGRAADVDWQFPDPQKLISSVHAEIRFRDGAFFLRDKSRNGTFLNGARIDSANREAPLSDGDRIAIGHYELSVRIDGAGSHLAAIEQDEAPAVDADVWGASDWASVGSTPEPIAEDVVRTPLRQETNPLDSAFQPAATASPSTSAFSWGAWQDDAAPAEPATVMAAAPAAAPQAPVRDMPSVRPNTAYSSEEDAVAGFGRGAALPAGFLKAEDSKGLEEAGRSLRVLVHGLYDLLKRQGEMKSVLGLERTVIRLADNNPLKFAASADEAMQRLIAPREGDLPGPSAALRSFDDVRRHEERLLTAMNEAVRSIVERLSPQKIKQRETGGGMMKIIPGSSKAAWWDELEREHARLLESDGAKLDELIEDELREAFTRHL